MHVTLACEVCKRRNYITTKNRQNDRERIELVEVLPLRPPSHAAQGNPLGDPAAGGAAVGFLDAAAPRGSAVALWSFLSTGLAPTDQTESAAPEQPEGQKALKGQ